MYVWASAIPRSGYRHSFSAFVIGWCDRKTSVLGAVCHVWGAVALIEACLARAIFSFEHGLIREWGGVYILLLRVLGDLPSIIRLSFSLLSCSFRI